ncbi:MAG: DNA polymerase IV [Candidatus Ancillula sp.]|jgi:DNA polymerase-4|nr:DNA polymerase IV [Candidatus Ancillula sp.]
MNNRSATILHVDMNAFFASCELLRRPELKGLPVVVAEDINRSVVSAASYEAREFGIRSAMPVFMAKNLCKDLVLLPVDMPYYLEVSEKVFDVFTDYTYKVEKVGTDEGFLDVSCSLKVYDSPRQIAELVIQQVKKDIGIDCCIGIGCSKSVAKLASGLAKPATKSGAQTGYYDGTGILEIAPEKTEVFLRSLDIRALYGVGPKTEKVLHSIGVNTVTQLLETPISTVRTKLGQKMTEKIYQIARGEDEFEVEYREIEAKSIGRERTLKNDTRDVDLLRSFLTRFSDTVASELRQKDIVAKTLTLVIATADRVRSIKSSTLDTPVNSGYLVKLHAYALLDDFMAEDPRKIRLIGISVSNFISVSEMKDNQTLFESTSTELEKSKKIEVVERVIDELRVTQNANISVGA